MIRSDDPADYQADARAVRGDVRGRRPGDRHDRRGRPSRATPARWSTTRSWPSGSAPTWRRTASSTRATTRTPAAPTWPTSAGSARPIHPDLAICEAGVRRALHRCSAMRPPLPRADETTLLSAALVAQTAVDLFLDPALVAAAWAAFHAASDGRSGGRAAAEPGCTIPARPAGRWDTNRRRPKRDGRVERDAARGGPGSPAPGGSRWPSAPPTPPLDFASANGWDAEYEVYDDFDLPTYVGPVELHEAALDHRSRPSCVGARSTSPSSARRSTTPCRHRSGARFGPRAIREAQYTSGSINSLQLDVEPFEVLTVVDAGDANIVPVLDRPRARPHLPQGARGRRDRRHPDRPGR